ncbi:MAG: hypothetical protein HeimC2_19950 [Candidatus Heimdallarchaeota archaeon LC_2]|nr:MAG: hypothetical protein HeimC2_19950 [Candidatus Heimdallarchaeota archaeon LC_2]
MAYTIKNYSEDYLESQYEIGNAILSKWTGAAQSSVESLKQTYSQEGFDPEMKFYAFKEDEMVGFCTSSHISNQSEDDPKKAFLEFPLVKEGHDEAFEQLFSTALGTLRDKGYKAVRSRAGEDWIGSQSYIEKYGFTFHSELFQRAEFDPHTIDISSLPDAGHLPQLDFEKHTDQLIELIKNEYSVTEDQAKAAVDNLISLSDQTIFHDIILEEEKIVGRMLVYYPTADQKDVVLFTRILTVGEKDQEYRDRLMKSAIDKLRKIPEIKTARIFLGGNVIDQENPYGSLKFKFEAPLSFYERKL